jgi:hypothetical protein
MEEQKTSNKAWDAYQRVWEASLAVQPGDDNRISNIQQSLLDSIKNLGENRRLRVVASQHGLTIVQWLVICIGAAITVLFTLFFPMRKAAFHVFLTVLVTVSLGLNIWLLAAYSTPFSGELKILPYMFELLRGELLNTPDNPTRYLNSEDLKSDIVTADGGSTGASKKNGAASDNDDNDDDDSATGDKDVPKKAVKMPANAGAKHAGYSKSSKSKKTE